MEDEPIFFFSFLLYNVHIFSRQSPISYVIPRICFCFYNWRDLTFWISTKFQLLLRANPCHIFMMVQDTRSIQFVISFDLGFEILPVCPPSYCCIWLRALFPPLPVLYNGILCFCVYSVYVLGRLGAVWCRHLDPLGIPFAQIMQDSTCAY